VVDIFNRESPLLAADTSLSGQRVADLADGIAVERGYPKSITVDNGSEFYSKAMDSWAYPPRGCSCSSSGREASRERLHRELQQSAVAVLECRRR
jgi:transposase InsO family protein